MDGIGKGRLTPFSLLVGVALSDQLESGTGNLWAIRGSHLVNGRVVSEIGERMKREGRGFSAPMWNAVRPNFEHIEPSPVLLKKGDLVTTELTPCIGGYYVQICRTLVMGEPSAEQRAAFAVYDEALEAGIASVRHGTLASEVARAENDVFRRHGLGDYVTDAYTRVRGHGLGLYVDTKPQILEDVHIPLEAGMTIIVHPNTYHPVVGYMVHGDALIVRQDGAEVLTATPRRLFSVPA